MSSSFAVALTPEEWSAYRKTLLHVHKLVLLLPSLCATLANHEDMEFPFLCPSSSTSLACASVDAVELPVLRSWISAATLAAPLAFLRNRSDSGDAAACDVCDTVSFWTYALGMWISARLDSRTVDSSSTKEWIAEVEMYKKYFVPIAWPFLTTAWQERLSLQLGQRSSPVHHPNSGGRGKHIVEDEGERATEAAVGRADRPLDDEEFEKELSTRVIEAMQRVARDHLRISWDFLSPSRMQPSVEAKLKQLSVGLLRSPNSVSAPRSAALPVIHTHCLGDLLHTLRAGAKGSPSVKAGSLSSLLRLGNALLHIGYDLLTKARAGMIERCYYLVPAIFDFERCRVWCEWAASSYTGPSSSSVSVRTATTYAEASPMSSTTKEVREMCSLLQALQHGLIVAAEQMYQKTVHMLLAGYQKRCVEAATGTTVMVVRGPVPVEPQNPLVAPDDVLLRPCLQGERSILPATFPVLLPERVEDGVTSTASSMRLSTVAFAVLVDVVEPTCELLGRCAEDSPPVPSVETCCLDRELKATSQEKPSDTPHLSAPLPLPTTTSSMVEARRAIASFVEQVLARCFLDTVTGRRAAANTAQQQAAQDTFLVSAYFSMYGLAAVSECHSL